MTFLKIFPAHTRRVDHRSKDPVCDLDLWMLKQAPKEETVITVVSKVGKIRYDIRWDNSTVKIRRMAIGLERVEAHMVTVSYGETTDVRVRDFHYTRVTPESLPPPALRVISGGKQ